MRVDPLALAVLGVARFFVVYRILTMTGELDVSWTWYPDTGFLVVQAKALLRATQVVRAAVADGVVG